MKFLLKPLEEMLVRVICRGAQYRVAAEHEARMRLQEAGSVAEQRAIVSNLYPKPE